MTEQRIDLQAPNKYIKTPVQSAPACLSRIGGKSLGIVLGRHAPMLNGSSGRVNRRSKTAGTVLELL